jgi:hypothetical protein
MAFLPPEKSFGGVMVPENPLAQAVCPEWLTMTVEMEFRGQGIENRCKNASVPGQLGDSIKNLVLSVEEKMDRHDPIKSAQFAAAIYLNVLRDDNIPSNAKNIILDNLSNVVKDQKIEYLFEDFVKRIGARAALEDVKNPTNKSLIEAVARGERHASERLKEQNPDLYNVVRETKGMNETFWSRLEANAKTYLRKVEQDVETRRVERMFAALYHPESRSEIPNVVECTNGLLDNFQKIANVNPDLANLARDAVSDILRERESRLRTMHPNDSFVYRSDFVNRIHDKANEMRSAEAKGITNERVARLLQAIKDPKVEQALTDIAGDISSLSDSYEKLRAVNPDFERKVQGIVNENLNKKNASQISKDAVFGRIREETLQLMRSSGALGSQKRLASEARDVVRGRAGAERD